MRVPLKDLFKCPTKERLKGARIKHLADQSIQTRSLSSEEPSPHPPIASHGCKFKKAPQFKTKCITIASPRYANFLPRRTFSLQRN